MREDEEMATFALIHGAADVGWYWHLVERELRARGHETVAPDLPCEDDAAGLAEYAGTMARAAGHLRGSDLVVVFKGVERETYSCAPDCERRITLGDSPAYFGATLLQTGTRTGQAQTAAAPR